MRGTEEIAFGKNIDGYRKIEENEASECSPDDRFGTNSEPA
jgi:hypothetical protein